MHFPGRQIPRIIQSQRACDLKGLEALRQSVPFIIPN